MTINLDVDETSTLKAGFNAERESGTLLEFLMAAGIIGRWTCSPDCMSIYEPAGSGNSSCFLSAFHLKHKYHNENKHLTSLLSPVSSLFNLIGSCLEEKSSDFVQLLLPDKSHKHIHPVLLSFNINFCLLDFVFPWDKAKMKGADLSDCQSVLAH